MKLVAMIVVLGLWAMVPAITQAQMATDKPNKIAVPDSVAVNSFLHSCQFYLEHDMLDDWLRAPNGWSWNMSIADMAALKTLVLNWIQNEKTNLAAYQARQRQITDIYDQDNTKAYRHNRAQIALKFMNSDINQVMSPEGVALFKKNIQKMKKAIVVTEGVTE